MASTFTNLDAATQAFLQHCGFPKSLIETSISAGAQGIQIVQMRMEGKTVIVLYMGGTGGSNIKVHISHKEKESAAFLADFSAAEKQMIQDAAASAAPLHPAIIPTIVLENVVRTITQGVRDIQERIENIDVIQADSPKGPSMSKQLRDIAMSNNAFKCDLGQLKNAITNVQKIMRHFEKQFGSDAQQTIEGRLANVLSAVEVSGLLLAKGVSDMDAQVSMFQRRMTIDSWKDGKSTYIMSILTLIFWPTTVVALFFRLPFFDWEAVYTKDILNPRWVLMLPVVIVMSIMAMLLWNIGTWGIIKFSEVNDPEEED